MRTPAEAAGGPPSPAGAPLRIAQVAPLYEAVPPALYGGTERVVSWLTEELVRRGHQVTLFASGDSHTGARLVAPTKRAVRGSTEVDPLFTHLGELASVQDQAAQFDVIHSHVDVLGLLGFRRTGRTPVVTTLHGRLDLPSLPDLLEQVRDMPLVSISDAQRSPAPRAGWIGTVYHGLPLTEYVMGAGRGDYAVFLGRISPEKRPDAAIEIARRAGMRLVIAAKIDDADRAYFEQIEHLFRLPGVDFIGEVNEREKVALLGEARALLFPILWPEPFGLAMIEAMACGTPVLTRRCGSTPEIVDDPRVGIVCDDDEGLVRALGRVDDFDRAACRELVERRFSVEQMADGYEAIYRSLCGRSPGQKNRALVPERAAI